MTWRVLIGQSVRDLTLACAVLATGLMAGVFYAYAISVNLGLAEQPDAPYVAAMKEINEKIQNPCSFRPFSAPPCSRSPHSSPTFRAGGRAASG